jgi:hypothetical protein
MKFEDQFNTIQHGATLMNLNIFDSAFFHITYKDGCPKGIKSAEEATYWVKFSCFALPAFTVYELIMMLPDSKWAVPYRYGKLDLASDVFTESKIVITKFSHGYEVAIVSIDGMYLYSLTSQLLAVVLTDMVIYLVENSLVPLDSIFRGLQSA